MMHITAIAEKDYEKKEKQEELDSYEIKASGDRTDISEEDFVESRCGFVKNF